MSKILTQTLFVDYKQQLVDAKFIISNPLESLKILISQQTAGNFNKDLLHILITTVMTSNNNNLKRLLYYYFETIIDEDCFIMAVNQINKDLLSPNEFIRALALKLTSKIQNYDHVNLSIIRENIKHNNYYVRLNAIYCLVELAIRFEIDIDQELISLLYKEINSKVIKMIFISMDRLSINYEEFLNTNYSDEVLELLIDKSDDIIFLKKCLDLNSDLIVFKSFCKLLSINTLSNNNILSDNILLSYKDRIINILNNSSNYKSDFIYYIDFIKGPEIIDFLILLNPFDFEFSSKIIDQTFKNAETKDFYSIVEILYNNYISIKESSDLRKKYKIMILEKCTIFVNTHCIYKNEIIENCLENIESEDPSIIYAGLQFLYAVQANKLKQTNFIDRLIDSISKMKYGKIFRYIFDILILGIEKDQFERLLEILENNFDQYLLNIENNESNIYYLSNKNDIFLGTHICLSISSMYKKEWGNDLKVKTIGIMLKFIEFGKNNNLIDFSSISTINTSIRALLNNSNLVKFENQQINILKPKSPIEFLDFEILNSIEEKKVFLNNLFVDYKESTIQLTGLGDPLYVECNIIYTKYEIILDILLINQTEFYLQDLGIYFTFSNNLLNTKSKYPTSIQPNSAISLKSKFLISDSSFCFISGSILFRYPYEGQYGNKPFLLNLGEIKLNISEFLEKAENIDFINQWKLLEWESVYSLEMPLMNSENILNKIVKTVNGNICNKESAFDFIVANVACFTIKKNLVLINICLSENKRLEVRVRSIEESIVKGVRDLIGECVRENQ